MPREISSTLDHDAAWIMTLWRLLHGENAAPGDIAADVIANLSQFLAAREDSFGIHPLPSPLCAPADPVEFSEKNRDATDAESDQDQLEQQCDLQCYDPDDFSIHHYYFNFKGVFYCLDRPASACLPTAA
jgi:hypothetical protein